MWCHIWLLALLWQGPKIPTTYPNKAVNELADKRDMYRDADMGGLGTTTLFTDIRVWRQRKWFSAMKSLCLHREISGNALAEMRKLRKSFFPGHKVNSTCQYLKIPLTKWLGALVRDVHGAMTEQRTFTPYKLSSSPGSLQRRKHLGLRKSRNVRQSSRWLHPTKPDRELSNNTREKHRGTAEGTWHVQRTGPWSQRKLHHHSSWQCIWVRNTGSDPITFSAQIFSIIPNESHSKHISKSSKSAVSDPKELPVWRPTTLKEPNCA